MVCSSGHASLWIPTVPEDVSPSALGSPGPQGLQVTSPKSLFLVDSQSLLLGSQLPEVGLSCGVALSSQEATSVQYDLPVLVRMLGFRGRREVHCLLIAVAAPACHTCDLAAQLSSCRKLSCPVVHAFRCCWARLTSKDVRTSASASGPETDQVTLPRLADKHTRCCPPPAPLLLGLCVADSSVFKGGSVGSHSPPLLGCQCLQILGADI